MKAFTLFLIITATFSAALAKAQVPAPATTMAPAASDAVADAQTLRVINDSFTRSTVKLAQTHYNVNCQWPTLKTADQYIHWTCLNNMTCAYEMTLPCFSVKAPKTKALEIVVSGLDDGTNEVESFKFTPIN